MATASYTPREECASLTPFTFVKALTISEASDLVFMKTRDLGIKPTSVANFSGLVSLPDSFTDAVEVAVYSLESRAFPVLALFKPLTRRLHLKNTTFIRVNVGH